MCACPAVRGAVCVRVCGLTVATTQFGMDDEDLALLRAQGVKSVKDFSRIKDLRELNLPPGLGRTRSPVPVCRPFSTESECERRRCVRDASPRTARMCMTMIMTCAVTREKVRDLVAFLGQDADQAPGESALSRMRTSLGGLLGGAELLASGGHLRCPLAWMLPMRLYACNPLSVVACTHVFCVCSCLGIPTFAGPASSGR